MSHGSWRGRRLGGCADAETAVEVGAWCAPTHTADCRGPGADEPRVCSQVEAIMASIVSNAEGCAHSRPRSPGVCEPARTCGETSSHPLSNYFRDLHFACRAQDTRSTLMRRCSTPSRRRMWPPFSSRRGRRSTSSTRPFAAGVGRGFRRAGGREGTRMRRAVAAERERTPEDTP